MGRSGLVLSLVLLLPSLGCGSIQVKLGQAKSVDDAKAIYAEMKAEGQDVNSVDSSRGDEAALCFAGYTNRGTFGASGRADVAEFLLANGANIEARDQWGQTPLMCAAIQGNAPVFRVLLAHGANVNAVDKSGRTVLTYATENASQEILALLRERNAVAGTGGFAHLDVGGAIMTSATRQSVAAPIVQTVEAVTSLPSAPPAASSPSTCPCSGANPVYAAGQCWPNSKAACDGSAGCQWRLCP